jgi:hypothetical protein
VTIGFQLGGQAYSEVVFFKEEAALDDFKLGHLRRRSRRRTSRRTDESHVAGIIAKFKQKDPGMAKVFA